MMSSSHDLVAESKAPVLRLRKLVFVALATTLLLTVIGVTAITSTHSCKEASEEEFLFRCTLQSKGEPKPTPTPAPTKAPTVQPSGSPSSSPSTSAQPSLGPSKMPRGQSKRRNL
jgi:hypothetical protein